METHNEQVILDRALEALKVETGLIGTILAWQATFPLNRRADALIELAGPQEVQRFVVEIKKTVDRFEAINQLRAFWPQNANEQLLLVAPYITPLIAERCRELQIAFIDAAGNAYIRGPGLHIDVIGKRKITGPTMAREGRATTTAGLKVVFALLCRPDLLNETYREIAKTARVALGTIGPVMKDLEARRYIPPGAENMPIARRRFLKPERLLEEWVTTFPTTLRPKLNVRRFRAPAPNWTHGLDLQRYGAFWGGEVAANRLLHYLQPQTATIYVRDNPTRLILDQRLKADVNGDIEILDVFWEPERLRTVGDVVPPLLAYADLFTTTEGRDLEAARMVYEQFIGPALRN